MKVRQKLSGKSSTSGRKNTRRSSGEACRKISTKLLAGKKARVLATASRAMGEASGLAGLDDCSSHSILPSSMRKLALQYSSGIYQIPTGVSFGTLRDESGDEKALLSTSRCRMFFRVGRGKKVFWEDFNLVDGTTSSNMPVLLGKGWHERCRVRKDYSCGKPGVLEVAGEVHEMHPESDIALIPITFVTPDEAYVEGVPELPGAEAPRGRAANKNYRSFLLSSRPCLPTSARLADTTTFTPTADPYFLSTIAVLAALVPLAAAGQLTQQQPAEVPLQETERESAPECSSPEAAIRFLDDWQRRKFRDVVASEYKQIKHLPDSIIMRDYEEATKVVRADIFGIQMDLPSPAASAVLGDFAGKVRSVFELGADVYTSAQTFVSVGSSSVGSSSAEGGEELSAADKAWVRREHARLGHSASLKFLFEPAAARYLEEEVRPNCRKCLLYDNVASIKQRGALLQWSFDKNVCWVIDVVPSKLGDVVMIIDTCTRLRCGALAEESSGGITTAAVRAFCGMRLLSQGLPARILYDEGSSFRGEQFQRLLQESNVEGHAIGFRAAHRISRLERTNGDDRRRLNKLLVEPYSELVAALVWGISANLEVAEVLEEVLDKRANLDEEPDATRLKMDLLEELLVQINSTPVLGTSLSPFNLASCSFDRGNRMWMDLAERYADEHTTTGGEHSCERYIKYKSRIQAAIRRVRRPSGKFRWYCVGEVVDVTGDGANVKVDGSTTHYILSDIGLVTPDAVPAVLEIFPDEELSQEIGRDEQRTISDEQAREEQSSSSEDSRATGRATSGSDAEGDAISVDPYAEIENLREELEDFNSRPSADLSNQLRQLNPDAGSQGAAARPGPPRARGRAGPYTAMHTVGTEFDNFDSMPFSSLRDFSRSDVSTGSTFFSTSGATVGAVKPSSQLFQGGVLHPAVLQSLRGCVSSMSLHLHGGSVFLSPSTAVADDGRLRGLDFSVLPAVTEALESAGGNSWRFKITSGDKVVFMFSQLLNGMPIEDKMSPKDMREVRHCCTAAEIGRGKLPVQRLRGSFVTLRWGSRCPPEVLDGEETFSTDVKDAFFARIFFETCSDAHEAIEQFALGQKGGTLVISEETATRLGFQCYYYAALDAEVGSVVSHGVFGRTCRASDCPSRNVMTSRVVVVVKVDISSGKLVKVKCRWVGRGFQDKRFHSGSSLPPCRSYTLGDASFLLLLQLSQALRVRPFFGDISTAFLKTMLMSEAYGDQNKEIWMSVPPTIQALRQYRLSEVVEVIRGLYGLKDAPKLWQVTLHSLLRACGFVQSVCDPCLWLYFCNDREQEAVQQGKVVNYFQWKMKQLDNLDPQQVEERIAVLNEGCSSVVAAAPKLSKDEFLNAETQELAEKISVHTERPGLLAGALGTHVDDVVVVAMLIMYLRLRIVTDRYPLGSCCLLRENTRDSYIGREVYAQSACFTRAALHSSLREHDEEVRAAHLDLSAYPEPTEEELSHTEGRTGVQRSTRGEDYVCNTRKDIDWAEIEQNLVCEHEVVYSVSQESYARKIRPISTDEIDEYYEKRRTISNPWLLSQLRSPFRGRVGELIWLGKSNGCALAMMSELAGGVVSCEAASAAEDVEEWIDNCNNLIGLVQQYGQSTRRVFRVAKMHEHGLLGVADASKVRVGGTVGLCGTESPHCTFLLFFSKLPKRVFHSSTGIELLGQRMAITEGQFVKQLCIDLHLLRSSCPSLQLTDSKNCVGEPAERNLKIDFYAIDQLKEAKMLEMGHIPGPFNFTDGLTKQVREVFLYLLFLATSFGVVDERVREKITEFLSRHFGKQHRGKLGRGETAAEAVGKQEHFLKKGGQQLQASFRVVPSTVGHNADDVEAVIVARMRERMLTGTLPDATPQQGGTFKSLRVHEEDNFEDVYYEDLVPDCVLDSTHAALGANTTLGVEPADCTIDPTVFGPLDFSRPAVEFETKTRSSGPKRNADFVYRSANGCEFYCGDFESRRATDAEAPADFDVIVDCRGNFTLLSADVDISVEKKRNSRVVIGVPIGWTIPVNQCCMVLLQALVRILKLATGKRKFLFHCARGEERSALMIRSLAHTLDHTMDEVTLMSQRPCMKYSFPVVERLVSEGIARDGFRFVIASFNALSLPSRLEKRVEHRVCDGLDLVDGLTEARSGLTNLSWEFNFRLSVYNPDSLARLLEGRRAAFDAIQARAPTVTAYPEVKTTTGKEGKVKEMTPEFSWWFNHAESADGVQPGAHGTAMSVKEEVKGVAKSFSRAEFSPDGRVSTAVVDLSEWGSDVVFDLHTVYSMYRADPEASMSFSRMLSSYFRQRYGGVAVDEISCLVAIDANICLRPDVDSTKHPAYAASPSLSPEGLDWCKGFCEEFGLQDAWVVTNPDATGHYTSFILNRSPNCVRPGFVDRNIGQRIDTVLVSRKMMQYYRGTQILYHVHRKQGDHCPVEADFFFPRRESKNADAVTNPASLNSSGGAPAPHDPQPEPGPQPAAGDDDPGGGDPEPGSPNATEDPSITSSGERAARFSTFCSVGPFEMAEEFCHDFPEPVDRPPEDQDHHDRLLQEEKDAAEAARSKDPDKTETPLDRKALAARIVGLWKSGLKDRFEGSGLQRLVERWSDPAHYSSFSDAEFYVSLLVDDVNFGCRGLYDGFLSFGQALRCCGDTGTRFGNRKTRLFVRTCAATGFEFNAGARTVSAAKINAIAEWPLYPRSPRELKYILGALAFMPQVLGIWCGRVVESLSKWARRALKEFIVGFIEDAGALWACRMIRFSASLNPLHPIDVSAVLKGLKILVGMPDAWVRGWGAVLGSIDTRIWRGTETAEAIDFRKVFCIHAIKSQAFPAAFRAGENLQGPDAEIHALLGLFQYVDPIALKLPRFVAPDASNLSKLPELHGGTEKALSTSLDFIRRKLDDPLLKILWSSADLMEDLAHGVGHLDVRSHQIAETPCQDAFTRPKDMIRKIFPVFKWSDTTGDEESWKRETAGPNRFSAATASDEKKGEDSPSTASGDEDSFEFFDEDDSFRDFDAAGVDPLDAIETAPVEPLFPSVEEDSSVAYHLDSNPERAQTFETSLVRVSSRADSNQLADDYFDFKGLVLAQHGITLRRRARRRKDKPDEIDDGVLTMYISNHRHPDVPAVVSDLDEIMTVLFEKFRLPCSRDEFRNTYHGCSHYEHPPFPGGLYTVLRVVSRRTTYSVFAGAIEEIDSDFICVYDLCRVSFPRDLQELKTFITARIEVKGGPDSAEDVATFLRLSQYVSHSLAAVRAPDLPKEPSATKVDAFKRDGVTTATLNTNKRGREAGEEEGGPGAKRRPEHDVDAGAGSSVEDPSAAVLGEDTLLKEVPSIELGIDAVRRKKLRDNLNGDGLTHQQIDALLADYYEVLYAGRLPQLVREYKKEGKGTITEKQIMDVHHYGDCMPPPSICNFFLILGFEAPSLDRVAELVLANCDMCRWMHERREAERKVSLNINGVSDYEADCCVFKEADWARRLAPRDPAVGEFDVDTTTPVSVERAHRADSKRIVRVITNGEPWVSLEWAHEKDPTTHLIEMQAERNKIATRIRVSDSELRGQALFGCGPFKTQVPPAPFYKPNKATAICSPMIFKARVLYSDSFREAVALGLTARQHLKLTQTRLNSFMSSGMRTDEIISGREADDLVARAAVGLYPVALARMSLRPRVRRMEKCRKLKKYGLIVPQKVRDLYSVTLVLFKYQKSYWVEGIFLRFLEGIVYVLAYNRAYMLSPEFVLWEKTRILEEGEDYPASYFAAYVPPTAVKISYTVGDWVSFVVLSSDWLTDLTKGPPPQDTIDDFLGRVSNLTVVDRFRVRVVARDAIVTRATGNREPEFYSLKVRSGNLCLIPTNSRTSLPVYGRAVQRSGTDMIYWTWKTTAGTHAARVWVKCTQASEQFNSHFHFAGPSGGGELVGPFMPHFLSGTRDERVKDDAEEATLVSSSAVEKHSTICGYATSFSTLSDAAALTVSSGTEVVLFDQVSLRESGTMLFTNTAVFLEVCPTAVEYWNELVGDMSSARIWVAKELVTSTREIADLSPAPAAVAVTRPESSVSDLCAFMAEHLIGARSTSSFSVSCGAATICHAPAVADYSNEVLVTAPLISISSASFSRGRAAPRETLVSEVKADVKKESEPKERVVSGAKILATMIRDGRVVSMKEVDEFAEAAYYFLKNTPGPSLYIRDRILVMLACALLEEVSAADFQDVDPLTVTLGAIISVMLDTGCLCGPGLDANAAKELLEEHDLDERSTRVIADSRLHVVHIAIAAWFARILLREGWPRVSRDSLEGLPHFVSGFTGGKGDLKPTIVLFRVWLMDRRSGRLYLSPLLLGYVMPGWSTDPQDNLAMALGEAEHTYMQVKNEHSLYVSAAPVRDGPRCEMMKFVKLTSPKERSVCSGRFSAAASSTEAPNDTVVIVKGETRRVRVPLPFHIGTRVQIDLVSTDRSRFKIEGFPIMAAVTWRKFIEFDIGTVKERVRISKGLVQFRVTVFDVPTHSTQVQARVLAAAAQRHAIEDQKKEASMSNAKVVARGIDSTPAALEGARKELGEFLERINNRIGDDERIAECILQWVKMMDLEGLLEHAASHGRTRQQAQEDLEVLLFAYAACYGKFTMEDGDPTPTAVVPSGSIGIEVVNPHKTPRAQPRRVPISEIEEEFMSILARMDLEFGVIEKFAAEEHGWLQYVSNTGRAKRRNKHAGRMITKFMGPNDVMVEVYVYSSIQSEIQARLMRSSIRFYCESDLSRAFPCMLLSLELSRWLGLHIGPRLYIARRAMLGLAPFPGLFSQITVPRFTNCRISKTATQKFTEELRTVIETEGWAKAVGELGML
eukprot:g19058.t1